MVQSFTGNFMISIIMDKHIVLCVGDVEGVEKFQKRLVS